MGTPGTAFTSPWPARHYAAVSLLSHAVSNNVEWCSLVSPIGGMDDNSTGVWLAAGTPAAFFPNAVTLRAGVNAADLGSALSDRPRCSVKDSFADVNLKPYGFRELFSASWIARMPAPGDDDSTGWSSLTDPADLESWCTAAQLPEVLPMRLLQNPTVRVLAYRLDGVILAGAIANRSDTVVGLSNVFRVDDYAPWQQIVAVVTRHFPKLPIVGYESGGELATALGAGFDDVGPLRVWLREDMT